MRLPAPSLQTALCAFIGLMLFAGDSLADHPFPLPDSWSNAPWDVLFTDDNPYNCMPATPVPGGADRNFIPNFQGLNMLRAITGPYAGLPAGDPTGYLQGYADLGFAAPDFDGAEIEVLSYDCAPGGAHDDNDCDNGNAPPDLIQMPATRYCAAAADNILRVMGHELFHHIQYAYIDFDNWTEWGRAAVEGSARMMEDQVFALLDDGVGVVSFLNQSNSFLANPGQSFWSASYDAALGWKYAAEQFGAINTEPERGSDFVQRFWFRAGANKDNADTPRTFEDTIREFEPGTSLESWFQDFSIANFAKQFDTSAIPGNFRYRYVDENDGNGTLFNNVAVDGVIFLPGGLGSGTINMLPWASAYYRAVIGDCRPGFIVGFRAIDRGTWFGPFDGGAPVRYAVLAIDNDGGTERVLKLVRGAADDYGVAFVLDSSISIDEISAVVTSTNSFPTVDYAFACGQGNLDIKLPTTTYKTYIGPPGPDRQKLQVIVDVSGPTALSAPVVKGLQAEDFSVYVGANNNPDDLGRVLAAVESGARYILTVWPPDKGDTGTYDLHVNLGPAMTDKEIKAVSYEELIVDEVVVMDVSGSMDDVTSPEGLTKIQSARNAGKALVDRANERGKVGAVAFESNAVVLEVLDDATSSHRADVKDAIDAAVTGGQTSIGDGLDLALGEFAGNGHPDQPDWALLLSDGRENAQLFWDNVKANVIASGVHVATFALGQDADFQLMEEIALETDGIFVPLDDDPAAPATAGLFPLPFVSNAVAATGSIAMTQSNALADAYLLANEAAEGRERLWESRGNVAPAMPANEQLAISEGGIRAATLAVHWSDKTAGVAVEVVRPDLTVLTNATAGVSVFSDDTHVVYHIDAITQGTWNVNVSAASGAAEYIGVLAGTDLQAATLSINLGGVHSEFFAEQLGIHYLWGLPQPITAVLTDKTGLIAGASVRAAVSHPDRTTLDLPLFDDGEHGDGGAGDGIYGNLYTRTTSAGRFPSFGPAGAYSVAVTATGNNNLGQAFTRVKRTAFFVGEALDPEPDTDGDEMTDRYEALHPCLDPLVHDADPDPDLDNLINFKEWEEGTDPCNPDTDHGGEADGSELARGANPFDPEDDALPVPIDPEVIDYVLEHMPFPAGIGLKPGTNLIRYPANPSYDRIRLWRATNVNGPFAMVADFDSTATGGLYPDAGLVNGLTYYYMVQPVDLNGSVGAYSLIFSGTPKADPIPPIGSVIIADNAPTVPNPGVALSLAASGDTTHMMIGNTADYDPAAWEPFSTLKNWLLVPVADGSASVYVRYRDADGNESPSVYSASVKVVGGGALGQVKGRVTITGIADLAGVAVRVLNAVELPPVFTVGSGTFKMRNVPGGTYTLEFSRTGYAPVIVENVVVPAGGNVEVGPIELTAVVPPASAQVPLPLWAIAMLVLLFCALGWRVHFKRALA